MTGLKSVKEMSGKVIESSCRSGMEDADSKLSSFVRISCNFLNEEPAKIVRKADQYVEGREFHQNGQVID